MPSSRYDKLVRVYCYNYPLYAVLGFDVNPIEIILSILFKGYYLMRIDMLNIILLLHCTNYMVQQINGKAFELHYGLRFSFGVD